MKSRSAGFYVVTLRKPPHLADLPVSYQWVIGHWNGKFWKLPGSVVEFQDDYFAYINEDAVQVGPEIEAHIRGSTV